MITTKQTGRKKDPVVNEAAGIPDPVAIAHRAVVRRAVVRRAVVRRAVVRRVVAAGISNVIANGQVNPLPVPNEAKGDRYSGLPS